MPICSSTVSTPSRLGSRRPLRYPLETMTPYRFTSSWSGEDILSVSPRTSTVISSSSSSEGRIAGKRGSFVDALTAFCAISCAMLLQVGEIVPMQPRRLPFLWIDTKTPARRFRRSLCAALISSGSCEGTSAAARIRSRISPSGSLLPERTADSTPALARRTNRSSFSRFMSSSFFFFFDQICKK